MGARNSAAVCPPGRAELLRCYHTLYDEHPHALLPLETALPEELRHPARDLYRGVLTMILSVRMADVRLTQALGRLFAHYPDFHCLRDLSMPQLYRVLRQATVVLNNPAHSGNGGRLWGFLQLYFGPWGERITEAQIQTLLAQRVRGFGAKVVRLLQAYCCGNTRLLPLDTPAFKALQACGLYTHWQIAQARQDIEEKLGGLSEIALVDLHELLRFRGQAGRVDAHRLTVRQQRIMLGWNAWRVLISVHSHVRQRSWLRRQLVHNDVLAAALCDYVQAISAR
jgi:endonuclease III